MKGIGIALLLLFAVHISAAPTGKVTAPAKPVYTTIDVPGAGTAAFQGTAAMSVNSLGVLAGGYIASGNVTHGFVRAADGTITKFDAPHAGTSNNQGTFPVSISSKGVIAGMYFDAGNVYHGFVRAVDGTITEFDVPGAGPGGHRGTHPMSINGGGTIAGSYNTGTAQTSTHWHGFVRTAKGKITVFDAPGAGTGDKQGTQAPIVINNVGTVAGTYTDNNFVYHGFVRTSAGTITTFDAPGAGSAPGQRNNLQFQGTIPLGISPKGVIVGVYSDASFVNHGFVRSATGTITSFDVAGAGGSGTFGTVPFSVNGGGLIAGVYQDAGGVLHGFTRSATGTITPFDVPGAGTAGLLQGSVPVNIVGTKIVGAYLDSKNVLHGFLRTPK